MTTKARQLLQKFENLTGAAWVASEGGRMSESGVEKRFRLMDEARTELSQYIDRLETENARLNEQRPLTPEEQKQVHDAWEEYKALAILECRASEKPAGKDTSLFANMLGRDA